MELKIYCPCGAKYKFDVEPVDGRMPFTVKCPVCGVDGTEAANATLLQSAATVEAAPLAPVPAPAPVPISTGLRIRPTESHAAAAPPPVAPAPLPYIPHAAAPKKSGTGALKTALTFALVGIIVLGVGYKWYRRINRLVRTATALGEASVGGRAAEENRNLSIDEGAVLFIKHSNHLEVAQACGKFWTNKLSRGLSFVSTNGTPEWSDREFAVVPAHHGYVRIFGGTRWPERQFDPLSQFLSETLGTTAIEYQENDFSGAFVFGVYENGERKLFAKKIVKVNAAKDDVDETVTVDGKEYALAHGFKPEGKEGWDDFDGEVITKRLGVKMWDEKEDARVDYIVMKEIRGTQPTGAIAGTNAATRARVVRKSTQ